MGGSYDCELVGEPFNKDLALALKDPMRVSLEGRLGASCFSFTSIERGGLGGRDGFGMRLTLSSSKSSSMTVTSKLKFTFFLTLLLLYRDALI